jgi:CheY-like chemotaxis protein
MSSHILIVDDEAPIRDILKEMLGQAGYRVTEAATPLAALEAVRRDRPDLLISDLQLEDGDGLAMIAQLKELMPSTPVILLTGVLFDDEVVRTSLAKVVTAYLPKTTPLAKILAEVKRVIGGGAGGTGESVNR